MFDVHEIGGVDLRLASPCAVLAGLQRDDYRTLGLHPAVGFSISTRLDCEHDLTTNYSLPSQANPASTGSHAMETGTNTTANTDPIDE